ncbi:hypothetical protein BC831DRAFT_452618 [Entophlyctis helioformis]|nr:hypothetical protein BC831DRAFT_452618 [Entophlyctis helioformis]
MHSDWLRSGWLPPLPLSTTAWQPGRARWSRHRQCRPLQQGTARSLRLTGHSIEHQHTPLVQSRPVSRVWRSALSILLSLIRPNAAPLAGCWPMHPSCLLAVRHTALARHSVSVTTQPSHASTPYATGLDALPCLRCGSSSSHLLLDRIIHCAWLIAGCSPIAPSPS